MFIKSLRIIKNSLRIIKNDIQNNGNSAIPQREWRYSDIFLTLQNSF